MHSGKKKKKQKTAEHIKVTNNFFCIQGIHPPLGYSPFSFLCVYKYFVFFLFTCELDCLQIILPAAFVCLAMLFALLIPPVSEEPPLELHPWIYTPSGPDPHLYMFYRYGIEKWEIQMHIYHVFCTVFFKTKT